MHMVNIYIYIYLYRVCVTWYNDDFSGFDLLCFGNVRASRIAHGGVKIKLPLSRVTNESPYPFTSSWACVEVGTNVMAHDARISV